MATSRMDSGAAWLISLLRHINGLPEDDTVCERVEQILGSERQPFSNILITLHNVLAITFRRLERFSANTRFSVSVTVWSAVLPANTYCWTFIDILLYILVVPGQSHYHIFNVVFSIRFEHSHLLPLHVLHLTIQVMANAMSCHWPTTVGFSSTMRPKFLRQPGWHPQSSLR